MFYLYFYLPWKEQMKVEIAHSMMMNGGLSNKDYFYFYMTTKYTLHLSLSHTHTHTHTHTLTCLYTETERWLACHTLNAIWTLWVSGAKQKVGFLFLYFYSLNHIFVSFRLKVLPRKKTGVNPIKGNLVLKGTTSSWILWRRVVSILCITKT